MKPLIGRTALITGGGSGIGAAIARALHGAGAEVILTGRRREPLELLSASLGERVSWQLADVGLPESIANLSKSLVDREVSILINNAGIAGPVAPLTDLSVDEWDEVFNVNVRGIFLMCRAFLPQMVDRGSGDVINIASVSGKRPLIRRTPYCASKLAVIGLSSTLAFEMGPSGVRVNTLSPGPVDGARMDRNFHFEAQCSGSTEAEVRDAYVSRAALGRMVTEEEVGAAALAMLSMTGLSGADLDLSAGMVA